MSKQQETYEFDPIKGYPMLNWKGKRPFKSTQYFPAQLKESFGTPADGWMNKIFWGDNLQVMSHLLKEYRGKINLIYIDPPFDSKADYRKSISLEDKSTSNDHNAFEEKQYADIWINDEYLQFIYERLILLRELLADNGSIYVHCDWHKGPYLRCIMDEIFGIENHLNQITWLYKTGGASKDRWAKKHDDILFYSKKVGNQLFNLQKEKSYMMHKYGFKKSEFLIDEETGLQYSYVFCRDVWDLPSVGSATSERVDYPTQKPEILLNRIIKASSNPGDIIFDCFMGSGTTQAVAMKLGRRFVGADINLGAIQTSTKRLINIQKELEHNTPDSDKLFKNNDTEENIIEKYYTGFEVYNVNHYDFFRNELEAKDLLIKALEINTDEHNGIFDGEKDGYKVKIMPTNRIATKMDINPILINLNYYLYEKKFNETPNSPVDRIMLVCMGHEPDLKASFKKEFKFPVDLKIVDILKDKSELEFKRESEAEIEVNQGELVIKQFYPMNLLQKLSIMKENVKDWREMVESIMIDWNYDGVVLEPLELDIPGKNELVKGVYKVPKDAGKIMIKITDLLSESIEVEVQNA